MQIKTLAVHTGVPVETIRHYEKAGLLAPPPRLANNYRRYDAQAVQRLVFIRNCRALDMSLDEVRTLLGCMDAPATDCGPVDALLANHLQHVRERLRALRALEQQLKALRAACRGEGDVGSVCSTLTALGDAQHTVPLRGVHSQ